MTRRSAPRSHNGCLNCRRKRVRCDVTEGDEKRTCMRCLRSRSKCTWSRKPTLTAGFAGSFHSFSVGEKDKPPSESLPTYGTRFQELLNAEISSGKSKQALKKKTPKIRDTQQALDLEIQTPLDRSSKITHAILKRTASISFQPPGDESERRLYHYWRVEAAPDIFGHANDALWDGSILLWGHEEPAIRSTVIALAAFHRNFVFKTDTPDSNHSLYHYNNAIKAVQNVLESPQKPSLQTVLCSCLFFYRIEGIRGEDQAKRKHLQAGLAIIKEATPEELEKVHPSILEIFALLDISHAYWSAFQIPCQLVLTTNSERSGLESCVPTTFPTTQTASSVLAKLSNWSLQFFHSPTPKEDPEAAEQEASYLHEEYERWKHAFMPLKEKYIDSRPITHLSETISAIGLYISFLNVKICAFSESKTLTDLELNPVFNELLLMIESLFSIYKSQGSGILHPRSIFFVRGVVTSTILIAVNTKDEYTLERVLKVMEKWPIVEGFYDGSTKGVKGTMELAMQIARLAGPLSEKSAGELGSFQEKLLDLESMRLDEQTNLKMWGKLTRLEVECVE